MPRGNYRKPITEKGSLAVDRKAAAGNPSAGQRRRRKARDSQHSLVTPRGTLKHKFGAKPSKLDGLRFDSKKEATYYLKLKDRVGRGEVLFFLRQVPFDLPGGVKYRCDFLEFLADGTCRIVDVKGFRTAMYTTKKKMVESLYPVTIHEV